MNPQFATVSLVSEGGGARVDTFRVPITHETTVRQLAKDSLQRFVHSRRGGKETQHVHITEVRVGGYTPSCAELFYKDMIAQVVLVKEEVIFMKVEFLATAPTKSTIEETTMPKTLLPVLPSSPVKTTLNHSTKTTAELEPPGPTQAYCTPEKSSSTLVRGKEPSLAQIAPSFTPKRRDRVEGETSDDILEAVRSIQKLERARLGWGPEASKNFPDNYVSSPQKLMRRRKASAVKAGTKQPGVSTSGNQAAAPSKPQDQVFSLPRGWGPEAHKCFPSNYVSSPDKLAREIRIKKRREEAERNEQKVSKKEQSSETSKAVFVQSSASIPSAARTARELAFNELDECAIDQDGKRLTIGHKVNPILVGEPETD